MLSISSLFEPEPIQWGLRGDPYLWKEMKTRLESSSLPESVSEFQSVIEREFECITGRPITIEKNFKVERFSRGGMSSGVISPVFWREKAIPLLVTRYHEV